MFRKVLLALSLLAAMGLAQAGTAFTSSAQPLYDLTLLGTDKGEEVMVAGQNPLTQQTGTDGWIRLRGRNTTAGEAGLLLSSLEGGFEGELVARLDRSELTNLRSAAGLMIRYSLHGESDYCALLWHKNGELIYRKKMGSEVVNELVGTVKPGVLSIWVRMRLEENQVSFGVAKDANQVRAPKVWAELGDRFAVSDFCYSGFVLLPAAGSNTLETFQFSKIALQPIGGEADSTSNSGGGNYAARRGFWGRQWRRMGNVGSEILASASDAFDWTVDNGGDALGVTYRVVVKRTIIPLVIFAYDATAGEILRVCDRGFGRRLPPYESIDEAYHPATVFADLVALDAGRTASSSQSDLFYQVLRKQMQAMVLPVGTNTSGEMAELAVDGHESEALKINRSVKNMKLYLADAIATKMKWQPVRKYLPENYKLYTKFTLEKVLTRTRDMLQYCYDAKTPDIFDVLVFPLVNDVIDCHQAGNKFDNVFTDAEAKLWNGEAYRSLLDDRDGVIQDAAEYLLLMGMMANIDSSFESVWRPQRNDYFGKVKMFMDGISGAYGNGNIPIKVYAGLAMNRISRGPQDGVYQQLNKLIEAKLDDDGGFAEGTDYYAWAMQEALPLYYWGVANGWIQPKDVPEKVRKSAEWLLNAADPSGFVPRVDDASSATPASTVNNFCGLSYWMAPYSLLNKDGRYMDYTQKMENRFDRSMSMQGDYSATSTTISHSNTIQKFLTYPVATQGPETWDMNLGAHFQGGIGKINFLDGKATIGVTLLAENGLLLEQGGSHDQQDNSSFTLSRWDGVSNTGVDHLVVDPGYPGYAARKNGNEARYWYHNTPFLADRLRGAGPGHLLGYIGGVYKNGMVSDQEAWELARQAAPYLMPYMCATAIWNSAFTVAGLWGGWALGEFIQVSIAPEAALSAINGAMLPFVSIPFACGQLELPNLVATEIEGSAGGGTAQIQEQYSNGLMSLQSYDVGGSSSRAVIQQDQDVLVLDFFYRDGVSSSSREYGVSYNLPGENNQVQSGNGAWTELLPNSRAMMGLFPGVNSNIHVWQDGIITYNGKNGAVLPAYRVSQSYQPSGNAHVFPHLSVFQVGDAMATFQPYTVSNACLGTEICVERTDGTNHRVIFVRSGYPSQSGQVVISLSNGQVFQSDAGFGILDEDLITKVAKATKLYHQTTASLAGQHLVVNTPAQLEWPLPAIAAVGLRPVAVKVGTGFGTFVTRTLYVDRTEVPQADYLGAVGQNPSSRQGEGLPVTDLTWYDAIAYANARSQQDGLPLSYHWSSLTRDGAGRITAMQGLTWDENASGYRLPTPADWQALSGAVPAAAWVLDNTAAWAKAANLGTPDGRGLVNLWGNVDEWTWGTGTTAAVVGGNAGSDRADLATTAWVEVDKASTSALRGFRLVRSDAALPPFFQFADTTHPWTVGGAVVPEVAAGSQGGMALKVGAGYQSIEGPVFRTSDLLVVGDKLLFDLFVPGTVPNPYWLGTAQVFVSIPSANVYQGYLGDVPLTGKPLGQWSTLEFPLNAVLVGLLKGDYRDVRFKLVVNTSAGTSGLLLQNLRFGGNLWMRPVAAVPVPNPALQQDQDLIGFENLSGWSSPAPLALNQAAHTQGSASLQLTGNGWIPVQSQPFASKSLLGGGRIAVDLYIPHPQPNPWWTGALQMVLDANSANLHGITLGTVDLTPLPQGAFQKVSFAVPPSLQAALAAGIPDLRVTLNLNTSNQAGPFLLDNLRSEP